MIRYLIKPFDLGAHLFEVTCQIEAPSADGRVVSLPKWIPGSYLIRDFARHVTRITATCSGQDIGCRKLDDSIWQIDPCAGSLSITILVYAYDLSVRGAYLDTSRGFFNGSAVFLKVHNFENEPCQLEIARNDDERLADWRVATAMNPASVDESGFGSYQADNYDDLIDHPIELGCFTEGVFEACGVPHRIVISGRHDADMSRLCRDLKTLCEEHIRFFGEPAPMDRYTFLALALGEGYGGLEHRASSSLFCRRDELPGQDEKMTKQYRRFLGLCSHEYFHSWNIKRIKPAAFSPYPLDRRAFTEQLWIFEGITSYYDDLALVRSGLIKPQSYLELLGQNMTRVFQTPGRTIQSLAESSFDAWIKFYQRNENTPNAVVSYYTKGSMVALALDLTIRRRTQAAKSLDDVMRAFWRRYANDPAGVAEGAFETLADEVTGLELHTFFDEMIRGTDDPPLADLFADVGVDFELDPAQSELDGRSKPAKRKAVPAMGVKLMRQQERLVFQHVFDGGVAQRVGIAAGDELLAINNLRVTPKNFDRLMARHRPGDTATVSVFHRDELLRFDLTFDSAPNEVCRLRFDERADAQILAHRAAWLDPGD